jgi:hypothetical protein
MQSKAVYKRGRLDPPGGITFYVVEWRCEEPAHEEENP